MEKLRYDKMLELKIEKAKEIGNDKAIFVFGIELDKWRGFIE